MPPRQDFLKVYSAGKLTVVGFGNLQILDKVIVSDCREEIEQTVAEHQCEILAFDLTGVRLIPSGLLGMLASLGRLGLQVLVYNPEDEVREVLEITRLDSILQIHYVEI